jgi:hypothetical protein
MMANNSGSVEEQGRILLSYMRNRIAEQMKNRTVATARSLILLKFWDKGRTNFSFRYWEEDFLGYINELWDRNERARSSGCHRRQVSMRAIACGRTPKGRTFVC